MAAPNQQLVVPNEFTFAQVSGSWCGYDASSVVAGFTFPSCNAGPANYQVITSPAMTLWHHVDAQSPLSSNTSPISITFGKLIYRVRLGAGEPQYLKCGESEADVTFSGPGGSVTRTFRQIWDPPVCAWSDQSHIGPLIVDEVFMIGGINQIVINPPPTINWEFLCNFSGCIPNPSVKQAHGIVVYGIGFQDQLFLDPRVSGCLTDSPLLSDDELLDLEPARQMLDSMWKLSKANGVDSARRERSGHLLVDSTGFVTFQIVPLSEIR